MFLFLLVLPLVLGFNPSTNYGVQLKDGKWSIFEGTGGIANGMWEENRYQIGWDQLYLSSSASYPATQQAYAVGYLEGALLQGLIWDAYRTMMNATVNTVAKEVQTFIMDNYKWTQTQVRTNPTTQYWEQVGLVLQQNDGMLQGYNDYAPAAQQLAAVDLLTYQASADLGDIASATGTEKMRRNIGSHCSALVKLTSSSLFSSHVTWSDFNGMLRAFKFYNTPFAPVRSMHYSGYPGQISSGDDYYLTSANLEIMETTNEIFDNSLYKNVVPQSLLYWIRITVATRVATTGQEFSQTFAKYNSGTYNNQWMAVDYKLYTPGQKSLLPGTLWILEQIPGFIEMQDKTYVLNSTGYWASYNIPYFPQVYDLSGYPALYKQYGDEYSYQNCARAQIFRRDQHTVTDLESMKHMMRYNEYQTDPLSLKDACRGISARCDLNDPWVGNNTLNGWSPFGGIDCKLTNDVFIKQQTTLAVAGPTWQSQPVFAWTEEWKYWPHWSHPTVFAFPFVNMTSPPIQQ